MTVVAGAHLQAVKNAILIAHSIDLVAGSPWKGPAIKHWALNEQAEMYEKRRQEVKLCVGSKPWV